MHTHLHTALQPLILTTDSSFGEVAAFLHSTRMHSTEALGIINEASYEYITQWRALQCHVTMWQCVWQTTICSGMLFFRYCTLQASPLGSIYSCYYLDVLSVYGCLHLRELSTAISHSNWLHYLSPTGAIVYCELRITVCWSPLPYFITDPHTRMWWAIDATKNLRRFLMQPRNL